MAGELVLTDMLSVDAFEQRVRIDGNLLSAVELSRLEDCREGI